MSRVAIILLVHVSILAVFCEARERIALIVGANRGLATERQLQFAVSDAKRVREVLTELGKFEESRSYLLANPSLHDIEKTMSELSGRIKEIKASGRQVDFLFYYSGHGNGEALHISGTSFAHDTLLAMIEAVDADLTISIIDACYSGALLAEKGIALAPPLSLKLRDTLSAKGTIWLTSSSSSQVSHESTDLGGSVFTHSIISALRGAADYDGSQTVSLSEAYGYARMNTSVITGNNTGSMQQPTYSWNIKGNDELCLSWLSRGSARLVLHGGVRCPHFIISEPSQTVAAEFTPGAKEVSIALPSGRYRIQRVCKNDIASMPADVSWKAACTLSLESMAAFSHPSFSKKGPLDQPSRYVMIGCGAVLLQSIPQGELRTVLPAVSGYLLNGNLLFGMSGAYGKSSIEGASLEIKRSQTHLLGSVEKVIINTHTLLVAAGIGVGADLFLQNQVRHEEERLRALGYKPLPTQKTVAPAAGVSCTVIPVIAGRVPVLLHVGAADHLIKTAKGRSHLVAPEFGLFAGWYFVR